MSSIYCRHSIEIEPMDDSSDSENAAWQRAEHAEKPRPLQLKRSAINALVMDYLVHEGFKEAAERFREEAGVDSTMLPDSAIFAAPLLSQRQPLAGGDVQAARTETTPHPTTSNSSASASNGRQYPVTISPPSTSLAFGQHAEFSAPTDLQSAQQQACHQNVSASAAGSAAATAGAASAAAPISTSSNINICDDQPAWLHLFDLQAAAATCQNKPAIETPEMIDRRIEVRQLIRDGDILKAKTLINTYYPELLDNHRELYFKLQQQHVIELIRNQKISEVITYVHEHVSVSDNLPLNEIERTLALLAYENPNTSPYSDLLEQSHRLSLASEVNGLILMETTGNVEAPKPRLVTLLKLMYWTQNELDKRKTPFSNLKEMFDSTESSSFKVL